MKFFYKLEQKFGRYAIKGLMKYIVVLYALGYIMYMVNPNMLLLFNFDMPKILHGQIWRLFTFILMPSETGAFGIIWTMLICFIYYNMGNLLERLIGPFYFNLYYLLGILGTALGGVIVYFISHISLSLGIDYINLSLFLAIGVTIPDAQFYLYGIIPVKAKWLVVVDAVLLAMSFITGGILSRVLIICSLSNFFLFLFVVKGFSRINPKQAVQRKQFKQKMKVAQQNVQNNVRHKCAVCGRTNETNPELEFRYCSKCQGAYEYCQDHLYTHVHVGESNAEKNTLSH
ncbi:MAG: hypothetical protein ACI4C1_10865 [Lachnospiraceae bacterium]